MDVTKVFAAIGIVAIIILCAAGVAALLGTDEK